MSERLLKVLLSELKTLRIRCQKCGLVIELDLDKLPNNEAVKKCPACGDDRCKPPDLGVAPQLLAFASAVNGLKARKDQVEVEFVLPDNDGGK